MASATVSGDMRARLQGFTLIELLVVLTVTALLLSIVAPRFMKQTETAKEAVLRENLTSLRSAIDQYYADKGRYPDRLELLVESRYLRKIPVDPVTNQSTTWRLETMLEDNALVIYEVKSGAQGSAQDGSAYASW